MSVPQPIEDPKPAEAPAPIFGRMLTEAEILREEIAWTRARFREIAAYQFSTARKVQAEDGRAAAQEYLTRGRTYEDAARGLSTMLGRVTRRMKGGK